MKKVVMAVGAVIVLGLIGAPYLTGQIAESETRRLIEELNQQSELYGTLDIANYDRGFASSNVSYEYALSPSWAAMTGFNEKIQYDCDYGHGISGIEYDCNLRGNAAYKAFVDEHFAGDDPLTITGAISASGGLTQVIENRAIDYTSPDSVVIKVSPSRVLFESNLDFSEMASTANIDVLEFADKQGSFRLIDAAMDLDIKPTALGLFEGEYVVSVSNLSLDGPEANISIDGFQATADSVEREAKMDSKAMFKLTSVAAKSPVEQREFSADSITLAMDVLGLSSEALVEYQNFARKLQVDLAANVEQGGSSEMDPVQLMALVPILEKMFDKDLKINVDASGNVFGAPNKLGFDLTLLEKTSFAQLSALAYNPELVMQNMDIAFTASLNQELVNSNPVVGAMMANSPLIKTQNDNFETQIKLGAEPSLNGQAVTFQELQSMIFASAQ